MGELLFWVGEDKMTFGSDYAIWEPKCRSRASSTGTTRVRSSPTIHASRPRPRRRFLGLNAAKLYDIEVPVEFQLPAEAGTPAAQDAAVGVSEGSEAKV
jgi:hypothetical protein